MDRIEFFYGFPVPKKEAPDYEEEEDEEEEDEEEDEEDELRGHVLEDRCADHRLYALGPGFCPVLFTLDDDDSCSFSSNCPGLPIFLKTKIAVQRCFQPFFSDSHYDPRDLRLALFFIEFSLEELKNAGVEVPSNLKGYKWNPHQVTFEQVEKPTTPSGWDEHTERWMPICTAPDEKAHSCQSGKLRFDDHKLVVEKTPFCTHLLRTTHEANEMCLMPALFARYRGPYCDCNCYCTNCGEFHLPSERKKHQPYGDGSGWPCD